MSWHTRFRWQYYRAIVLTKTAQFGIQFGVVPVGFDDRRFEVVGYDRLGNATKVTKGIFNAMNKIVGRLLIDRLPVPLARMAQDDTQDMRPPSLTVLADDRSACAEVDLSLLARGHLDATKRQRRALIQLRDEASHAVIFSLESVFQNEILKDSLSRKILLKLGKNRLAKRGAKTARPGWADQPAVGARPCLKC